MNNEELVNTALDNLRSATAIRCKWKARGKVAAGTGDGTIALKLEGKSHKIPVVVMQVVRYHHLHGLTTSADGERPPMVVAPHISQQMKGQLRERGADYLDASGNIYLSRKGLLIWIDGRKQISLKKESVSRAFTRAGLRVVFHFLFDERILNYTYRDIAEMADVGLGNVGYVMNGLKEAGYMQQAEAGGYELIRKQALLDRWITAYGDRLKPSLLVGRFSFRKGEDLVKWKRMHLASQYDCWGGEPGGEGYTNYTGTKELTIYTTREREQIIKGYRLVPDDEGSVLVYRKFWNCGEAIGDIAPALLVYADLMISGGDRCIEMAQKIYRELLQDKF